MKVRIVVDLCSGCGLCNSSVEEVFDMGDDGIAVVKMDVIQAALEKAVKEAAADCPSESIIIE